MADTTVLTPSASAAAATPTLPIAPDRLVPLVLHRLVAGTGTEWEDVHVTLFARLAQVVGSAGVVLHEGALAPRAGWLITFDDGNLSDHANALPILLEYGARATFFVIADEVGRSGRTSWSHLREMHALGMVIGSHSASHRHLTRLDTRGAAEELGRSRRVLEDGLGAAVKSFSYPYGDCNPTLHAMAREAGYRHVFTSAHGVVRDADRPMPRNSIHGAMDAAAIDRVLRPSRSQCLRWAVEDRAKAWAKRLAGHERYMRWRDRAGGAG